MEKEVPSESYIPQNCSEEDKIPTTDLTTETTNRKGSVMLRVLRDANKGFPELRKRNPELYKKITDEQHEVAEKRRRAASSKILDMRLD